MDNGEFADLHVHSNRSDGLCSPSELIDKAVERNLRAIAIVDHDDVSALEEAIPYARANGIELIPGVELSVTHDGLDFHLLGYCFNQRNPALLEYLHLFKSKRVDRAEKIVDLLSHQGIPISSDVVMNKAGKGTVGRPHIAEVMLEEGHVFSFQDAFNRFLGNGRPAYVPSYRFNLSSALALISAAGGISCIAHPGQDLGDAMLLDLIKRGVKGIETIHPRHNEAQTRYLSDFAKQNGLLETGGSDFHGGKKGENAFGFYKIPYESVVRMKELALKLRQNTQ